MLSDIGQFQARGGSDALCPSHSNAVARALPAEWLIHTVRVR